MVHGALGFISYLRCFDGELLAGRRQMMAVRPNEIHEHEAKWLLIDGMNLIYRQFHALPRDFSYNGQSTGAIFGMANMLLKTALPYALVGSRLVLALESTSSWREGIDTTYKAHRPRMPPELRSQIEPVIELAEAFGAVSISVTGQEADDVIASVIERHCHERIDVLSDDKDLFQLVSPTVRILRGKDSVVDEATVLDNFGVLPDLIPDFLALTGDSVDNVAGVKGIGPKSAAKLLNQFGDLEAVLEKAPTEASTTRLQNIMKNADKTAVRRAKSLTLLNRHCDLPLVYCPPIPPPVDWDRIVKLADTFGLAKFKSRLRKAAALASSSASIE